MSADLAQKEILKWTGIIYHPERELIRDISNNWTRYRKIFINRIAGYLYEDMRRARVLITAPFTFNKVFSRLTKEEKAIWYEYASEIPDKLKSLNLFIRPWEDFCKTCIITDEEIEKLALLDHESFFGIYGSKSGKKNVKRKISPARVSFKHLPGARKWFFKELNYLVPPQLKKIGFEIVRPEEAAEIDMRMIKKLARAVHSRYLQEMRKLGTEAEKDMNVSLFHYPGDSGNQYMTEYENLPDEIIYSNNDNAYHIPTKLLAIGYKIRHVQKDFKTVTLHLNDDEIETMARVEHIRWSWDKRLNGWIYGSVKDNENKIHPGLLAFEDLPESEKEKDRELVRLIPALLQDIDYEAYPINPDRIKKLSYAIKPQSSIHKLLNETRKLNNEITELVSSSRTLKDKMGIINKKIEETIGEVQGNYMYAQHIQKTILPDGLSVRECFPDSFVLFKPKDIVSGDFYFFSRQENLRIFAAADCTGHGIPGALLSIIGYGTLDQAVNELKLTNPSEILHDLYSRIHRFLRRDEEGTGLSDDMDIILCTLDLKTNVLNYSGVGLPLYRLTRSEMIEYKPQTLRENCTENGECPFKSENIRMNAGDTIYLCSDGYFDQFGGEFHKKYQRSRFKEFLLNIQHYSLPEQSDRLFEEMEQWRAPNDEDQTDDILVIGVRI